VDETVDWVKEPASIVSMVIDSQRELTLDVDVFDATDNAAFGRWLAPSTRCYEVEVLVNDEHGSYGVVAV
jgi:hypothetical protein